MRIVEKSVYELIDDKKKECAKSIFLEIYRGLDLNGFTREQIAYGAAQAFNAMVEIPKLEYAIGAIKKPTEKKD